MLIEQIQLENGCALGLLFEMQKYPLLVIKAEKGFLMCGYLNVNAAETLGDTAAKELEQNNLRNAFFNSNEIMEQCVKSFKYSVKIESSYFAAGTKVKGVQNFEDMLKAQVVESTQLARKLGIEPGMTGKEALERMF